MAVPATQIRRGQVIIFNGDPCRIIEFEHRTPGNLRAFIQAKMKNLRNGATLEHRRGRSLAVGAGDDDGVEAEVGAIEIGEQAPDVVQPELDAERFEREQEIEGGHRRAR